MDIIQSLPLPDEICHKIVLYVFKSPHIHLQEEIFKRVLSIPIYKKLVEKGGIKKVNGYITKVCVWDDDQELQQELLDDTERMSLTFEIQVLHVLQNLTQIDLGGTGVKGDIQVLHGLQHLTEFNFDNTGVFGNIQVLHGLQHLTEFVLMDTNVFGNIQVLQGLQNLTFFDVDDTDVSGDEEAFHEYRKSHGLKVCRVTL